MIGNPPLTAGDRPVQIAITGELDGAATRAPAEIAAVLAAANTCITALRRERAVLIAVLAAFPFMLMTLVVLVLAHPIALPGPSLSLAAAVAGCLLTGTLIAVGAWVAVALLRLTP